MANLWSEFETVPDNIPMQVTKNRQSDHTYFREKLFAYFSRQNF
jgi:hypothetical protein